MKWQEHPAFVRTAYEWLAAETGAGRQALVEAKPGYDPDVAPVLKLISGSQHRDWAVWRHEWVGPLHHSANDGPLDDVLIENFVIGSAKLWGDRNYGWRRNVQVKRGTIYSVEKEHGWYLAPVWGWGLNAPKPDGLAVSLQFMRFTGCGSQAFQTMGATIRRHEVTSGFEDEADTPGGLIELSTSLFEGVGWRDQGTSASGDDFGARPAHAVQFQCSKNPVKISNVGIFSGPQKNATGCLLVEGGYDPGTRQVPDTWDGYEREVTIENLVALTSGECDRPIVRFQSLAKVRMSGKVYIFDGGPRQKLEIEDCKDVVIAPAAGNVDIWVDGKLHGPISGGFKT